MNNRTVKLVNRLLTWGQDFSSNLCVGVRIVDSVFPLKGYVSDPAIPYRTGVSEWIVGRGVCMFTAYLAA